MLDMLVGKGGGEGWSQVSSVEKFENLKINEEEKARETKNVRNMTKGSGRTRTKR
jgi:hypothetical protein